MRNSQRRPLDIAGLLVDLDGVVYVGADLLPGARAAFETLDARGVPYRFITSTTRRSRVQIVEKLAVLGLPVEPGLLFTPASLAAAQLRAGRRSAFLVAADDLAADFAGCDGPDGEAVVVADAGDRFSYDMMNRAYRKLHVNNKAELVMRLFDLRRAPSPAGQGSPRPARRCTWSCPEGNGWPAPGTGTAGRRCTVATPGVSRRS